MHINQAMKRSKIIKNMIENIKKIKKLNKIKCLKVF